MAVLSDQDIRAALQGGQVGLRGLPADRIQPASVDLTLGDEFLAYQGNEPWNPHDEIDLDDVQTNTKLHKASQYRLMPGEFILGTTEEYVSIPHDIVAVINGRSSLARLGLLIHITAGFIDPGFEGKVTLEIVNLNRMPIILRPGKPICQISFLKLSSEAQYPYGHPALHSKYQHQEIVTASKYDGT